MIFRLRPEPSKVALTETRITGTLLQRWSNVADIKTIKKVRQNKGKKDPVRVITEKFMQPVSALWCL